MASELTLGPTVPALYTLCVIVLYAQRIQCGCCIAKSTHTSKDILHLENKL